MNDNMTLNASEVEAIIKTLKGIKVRGFDSMDKVVGLVMFFENKMKQDNSMPPIEVENNGTD